MSKFINSIIGVWVGKDIEIVRTGMYELTFQRIDSRLEATWSQLEYGTECITKTLLGKCVYMSDGDIYYAYSIKDAEDKIYSGSNSLHIEKELGRYIYSVNQNADDSIIVCSNNRIEKIQDNILIIEKNDKSLVLHKSESIEIADSQDPVLGGPEASIEERLVSWQLGTKDGIKWISDDSIDPFVEINTNKHMYIFVISDKVQYCRASRYAVCDLGVVFAQNFRIFKMDGRGKQAYMVPDNLVSKEKLNIDPKLFAFDSCQTTPKEQGGVQAGIYWSVKKVDHNYILLHGCEGQEFIWSRNDYKSEYFKCTILH